jgi:hypothetical protein
MTFRWFAMALAIGLASCSLMQLDDLEIDSCERDIDCSVLSHEAGAAACYRCELGRCERHGSIVAKVVASTPAPEWSSALELRETGTLLALGTGDDTPARGFEIDDGSATDRGFVSYSDGTPMAKLRALSLDGFASRYVVGLSVDGLSCEDGRIRIGVASVDEPFMLRPNGARTVFSNGVDVDPMTQCTGTNRPAGARAPALATISNGSGHFEALALWLASSQRGLSAGARRCEHPEDTVTSIEALRLTLRDAGDTPEYEAADRPAPFVAAEQVLVVSAPRAVASTSTTVLGYLMGFIDPEGIVLRVLPAFGAADSDAQERISDAAADQLAIVRGSSSRDAQTVLVVWTSGCTENTRVLAAVYRWSADGLERIDRMTISESGPVLEGPVVAYSASGFSRTAPRGGWAVAWIEERGSSNVLRVSRIREVDRAVETTVTLNGANARLPFVDTPKSAPFAYGFVSPVEPERNELTVLRCE